MKFIDLVTLIFDNLNRRKARVALTAIGVIIGTAAVIVLVSLAIGLQQNAISQLYGIGDLTQIYVYPNYGDYGPGPMPPGNGNQPPPNQKMLTQAGIDEISGLPGVSLVVPKDYMQAPGTMTFNRLESWAGFNGITVDDLSVLGVQAQEGSTKLERGGAIIGYTIPNNFWDPNPRPGQEPGPPPNLAGETVRLTLMKWDSEGNEIRRTFRLKIVGILAESRSVHDWSMYIPMEDLKAYNEWYLGRRIDRNKDSYSEAIVKVTDVDDVLDIFEQIKAMGYYGNTDLSYVEGINSFFLVLQVVFGGVGAIALLVAAIGIANTMAMAILERTREIGLMKAIGATNRDVLSIFLGEAAGIGFIGGLGGVIIGWLASQIINVLAVAYMAGQAVNSGGPPPPTSAVYTPTWLPVFALFFATIIGLLSGLYPSLRAATLIPINALKYE